MFKVHFTNLNYYANQQFQDAFSALEHAKDMGFEATVKASTQMIAAYSPISGVKWHIGNLLTVIEAASLLGVTKGRVYQFCQQGRLKYTLFGKTYQISLKELENFGSIPRTTGKPLK